MKRDIYKPKEFAEATGVTVKTLQRWDREGTLVAHRTGTDRRYYTYSQYLEVMGAQSEVDDRKVVIYARVPAKRYDKQLQFQIQMLKQYCKSKDIDVDDCIWEYASGNNYNRREWRKMMDEVMNHKIKKIIIAHEKILVRFGYEWIESICDTYKTKIEVVGNENLLLKADAIRDAAKILEALSEDVKSLGRYADLIEEDSVLEKLLDE